MPKRGLVGIGAKAAEPQEEVHCRDSAQYTQAYYRTPRMRSPFVQRRRASDTQCPDVFWPHPRWAGLFFPKSEGGGSDTARKDVLRPSYTAQRGSVSPLPWLAVQDLLQRMLDPDSATRPTLRELYESHVVFKEPRKTLLLHTLGDLAQG